MKHTTHRHSKDCTASGLWSFSRLLTLVVLLAVSAVAMAQGNDGYMIAGTVMDEKGEPLIGVTVQEQGSSNGIMTDLDGKFRVKGVKPGNMLVFSYIGYKTYKYKAIGNKEGLKIVLNPDISTLDEVVVVGAGNQKKISMTGAITTVDPEALEAPATSVSNMLGGNVPGIIAVTRSGEPGDDFSEFWIRGIGTFGASSSALVLIDGVEGNLNDLDPADIESFSVLKDASATAIYGVKGANGVVIVTTKSGKAGKLNINFKTNLIMSESARMPEYVDAYQYATLANEARLSRDLSPRYTPTEVELFRTGLDPDLYPDVNWRDVILKDHVWQNQHFLSISGGGTNARYYMSLSVQNKDAIFKQDKKANKYNTNVAYHKYSFTSKIDANLTKTTTLSLKLNQVIVDQNSPGYGTDNNALWSAQANLTPVIVPVMYSNGLFSAKGTNADETNPYVQLNYTGYKESKRLNTDLQVILEQDLKMIAKGLKIKGVFAYAGEALHNQYRIKNPDLYRASGRFADGTLILSRTVNKKDLTYTKSSYVSRHYQWELMPSYNRSIGDHDISALARFYIESNSNSDSNNNIAAIPKRYESLSGRINYGFMRTYFAEFNLGYTGSEQFPRHHRFGLFPAVSGGWIPTEYKFVKDNMPWMNYLKLRVSYGLVGNDNIGGNARFPYLTTIVGGGAGWNGQYGSLQEGQVGTDGLVWEKSKKLDIGIDAHFLNDMISLTVDYFNDNRTGIFQQRATVPLEVGLQTLPWANVGSMKSWGFDGNATFSKGFGADWRVTARANFTFSRNKVTNWEQANIRYPYQSYTGVPYGILRGLIAEGLFKDWDDVYSSPKQTYESKVYPGDIKYKDVNGDGVINDDDIVPLSYSSVPEFQYGFAPEIRWKNLTVSALFEGTAHSQFFFGGTGFYPFAWGDSGNVLTIVADQKNRWTSREISGDPATENPNARFPRLSYGQNLNNNRQSTFWLADNSYLRFKNLTIRYRYTNEWLQRILSVQNVDVSFIMQNICTWDNIKLWDPGQVNSNGAAYPIQRTYTLQLNVNF